ncbi:PDR/VanB family oxidoreductase [Rathayibacter tanaceti]|uniref:2Fe-2S iron-sulfur cluster binding domain-containing protein n=2 Tax=Rathayibacter tanaceti TaxID=1671680 RepID=A0A166H5F0_9MICO|nr:PDR/VanB family oxidoreductase [Rathayibacter tanaceti]KZX19976.1 Phthalate dioxygenase reductase [Rathayibacter tanaceti]QHC54860.1 2Fe-2S iron-sulfur cluster binding domain-containing protein [Rathayibacter tanaceti]TCO38395.1 phthalate 4,5-dioxygenase reductase subunit [Rathayibacter tanaceti]
MPDLRLVVAEREVLTPAVTRFVLRNADDAPLPGYSAGAHLTLTTPSGARRSYSLVEPGSVEPPHYVIAVRREPHGRGGSRSLHDDVRVGDVLAAAPPANTFALEPARRYLLIAGGIGITPIRAMAAELRAQGSAAQVVYLSRSPADTAWRDEFTTGGALVHHSAEHGRLDLWPFVAEPDDDARIYCCGPSALIDEVLALTMHWRPSRIHVEDFAGVDALGGRVAPFTAVWEPTGAAVDVGADRSMLASLRSAGIDIDSSCESGTCGTCRLRLVRGTADHRDLVLLAEEREHWIMPCVSRAAGGELVVGPVGSSRPLPSEA